MTPTDTKPAMQAVRGLDASLWRRVKTQAASRGVTMGEMLNEIMREWLSRLEHAD